ncbi:PKD domain-containing protein [bacterium]|nr:PKD domain-containing protein [bacterium]
MPKTPRLTALVLLHFLFSLPLIVHAQTQFVENKGQWPQHVLARGAVSAGAVFLENNAITYQFWDKEKISAIHHHSATDSTINFHVVKLNFLNANPKPFVEKTKAFKTIYNYYLGNNPDNWGSNALAYQSYLLVNIYPQIDLLIESTDDAFKYSFVVNPGGNPDDINIQIEGADDVFLDNERLKILTSLTHIEEESPYSYQPEVGNKTIASNYNLEGNRLKFTINEYNNHQKLVIDPSVIFSSLSLSVDDNWGYTATYDEAGNGYTGGTVYGDRYPVTVGAYQKYFAGGPKNDFLARDCGLYKLNPDGTQLIYMTFLGGSNNEQPHSLVVNSQNELIVYGTTESSDFPTKNGVQGRSGGRNDIFLARLNSDGTALLSATYLGGSGNDGINGDYKNENNLEFKNPSTLVYNYGDLYRGEVIVDRFDNVLLASTTESSNFPTTSQAFERSYRGGGQDGIVVKLSPDLDSFKWSSFLGGSEIDAAYSLDFDKNHNIYVTGGTKSNNFPIAGSSYDNRFSGGMADAFVALISADGTKLLASTYLGTNDYDQGFFIKVGPDNSPYVLGQTLSAAFPTKNTTDNATRGIFITKMKKDLSAIKISKKIGANNIINISPAAFSVDLCGRVYFSGWGGLFPSDNSTGNTYGLKTTVDAAKTKTDGRDFYIAVYTADLATPIYATFWGGDDTGFNSSSEHVDGGTSRFDKRGVVYQAICAACNGGQFKPASRFPTYPNDVYGPSSKHNHATNCNNAIVKIDLEGPALYAEFDHTELICKVPQTVKFTNHTQGAHSFIWHTGDGTTSTDSNITHTYTKPGVYQVELIAYNALSCNLRDTLSMTLKVYAKSEADFSANLDVCTKEITLQHTGKYGKTFTWDLGDGASSNAAKLKHTYANGDYTIQLLTDENTDCADTFSYDVHVEDPFTDFALTLDTCSKTISTTNFSKGYKSIKWFFRDGSISTEKSPDHTFSQRGDYKVSLHTNLFSTCEDSMVTTVHIMDVDANFDIAIDTCSSQLKITNNSIDAQKYKWQLSDGRKFTDTEPLISFSEYKKYYRLKLTAAPFSQCFDTSSIGFRMPGLPDARFSYNADTCVSALQFFNESIDAPNFLWDFGNGETSRSRYPFQNYRDTGEFLVSLIAYPGKTCADTVQKLVYVDTFRFAQFDLSLDTCSFEIKINNSSEDLDSFFWQFGDGNQSGLPEPTHGYMEDGTYLITLYGEKTRNHCRDTFSMAFTIPKLPKAMYRYTTDSCLNTFLFTNKSAYAEHAFWWAENGTKGTGEDFKVTFMRPDSHKVYLVAESPYSCYDTVVIPLKIDSMPTARFGFNIDSCDGALQMNNTSYGGFKSFWNFDDNLHSFKPNPYVKYENEGQKTVVLVINAGTECADSIVKTAKITQYVTGRISMTNVFTPNGDGKNDVWKVDNLRPDCDDYVLLIYDRWGVLVREIGGNEDFEWDGNNHNEPLIGSGKPLNPGVYFYVLISNQVKLNGSITIIR